MLPFFLSAPTCISARHSIRCLRWGSSQVPDHFKVLGVPRGSDHRDVKRAFVRLALEKHPDRQGGSTTEFLKIRQAYDAIRSSRVDIVYKDEDPSSEWSSDQLQEWFRRETGDYLSFDMCENTRKEVIDVYSNMSRPLNDKGGYWEMARMLSEREMSRGAQSPEKVLPLQIAPSRSKVNRRRKKR